MNVRDLARPEIRAMSPYVSARNSADASGVLLNANEAPLSLIDDPALRSLELNRYPAPQPEALCQRLASLYQVNPQNVLVTRGSDEGIDLLLRVFCQAGRDQILECPPCFGMYRIAAKIQGAGVVSVPRVAVTLALDSASILSTIRQTEHLKLVFLTSPNNPTGDLLPDGFLQHVLHATRDQALVVLDEAYIEFCSAGSATDLIAEHPHLVVLRTLSKAWAAAGLRCGAVIADPAVIDLLGRVMAPYPLTAPAISTALAATGEDAAKAQAQMLENVHQEKGRLLAFLNTQSWVEQIWPGSANFVLIRVGNGPDLVAHCDRAGVKIRDFSLHAQLENCVRLTIGSANDMRILVQALTTYGASS